MAESFINILIGLSAQAVIMGVVIIILQTLLRKQIPPIFNFLLWILVFVKLIIPINFQSILSVFQIFRRNEVINGIIANRASDAFSHINFQTEAAVGAYVKSATETSQASLNIYNILLIIWIAVAVVLLFIVFQYYYSVKINLYKNHKAAFDDDIMELADDCFDAVGIPRETEITCSSYANTPFVFGLLKPLIVIPYNLFESISKDELRIIIMHEAVHIKRNHYRIKFLITFINIIHWYNPITWYFSRLINKEMEFDCDYALLRGDWKINELNYAETLLNVAKFQKNKFILGLTFGETNFLKRVAVIMKNRKFSNILSIISLTLVIVLSVSFFTLAKENKEIKEQIQYETIETLQKTADSSYNTETAYTPNTAEEAEAEEYDEKLETIYEYGKDIVSSHEVSLVDNIFDNLYENIINNDVVISSDHNNNTNTNNNNSWVNNNYNNLTKEELIGLLPYKLEAQGSIKDIDKLKIDIDNCYVFIEYTDEEYIRMEFYSLGEKYLDAYKYKYGISERGNQSTVSVTLTIQNGNIPEPKAVIIYIPQSINDFEIVDTKLSMCNAIMQGLKARQLKTDMSMSTAAIYNCDIRSLDFNSSMGTARVEVNELDSIDMDTSMGTIDIAFNKVDSLEISSSMSNIDIDCGEINEKANINASMDNISIKFVNEPKDLIVKGITDMSTKPDLPSGWTYDEKAGFLYIFGKGSKAMTIDYTLSNIKIE